MQDIISRLTVAPQRFECFEGPGATFARNGAGCFTIEMRAEGELCAQAEQLVCDALFSDYASGSEGGAKILLELGENCSDIPNYKQGYRLSVRDNTVTLTGFGQHGLLYGAVTLSQLIKGQSRLPAFEITDWPDIEKRGHFIESRFGTDLMELSDWQRVIDDMVQKKQNTLTISLYGCWCIQFDNRVSEYIFVPVPKYPRLKTPVYTKYYSPAQNRWIEEKCDTPIAAKDFFGEICRYGKKWGVEVIPLVNSYGHNTLIPDRYPEVSAKYEDGSPTYNGFCTSTDATYELLFDLYDTIIDNYLRPCGITSFDIGLDEVGLGDETTGVNAREPFKSHHAFCRCEKCRDISAKDRFISHAIKLISHLKARGMTSVYVYNDMLYRAHRAPEEDFLPDFVKAIEEAGLQDVTVINWWKYNCKKAVFDRTGFGAQDIIRSKVRCVVKPMNGYYHWHMLHPAIKNSYLHGVIANETKCMGYLSYSCWDDMYDRVNSAQAGFSWSFEQTPSAEAGSRAYCRRLFPTACDKAYKAFELLDLCNEEGGEKRDDGTAILSTRTLSESILSYYPYSYLRLAKRYPRNFPGEAMTTILNNRTETERLIYQALGCAESARRMFEEIAATPGCDRYFAQIYELESENFVLLYEDYLALLRMHDLNTAGLDEGARAEIIKLAAERKNARLLHMAKRESLKSACNAPIQLRHQSIFMQLFADIESYALANTADSMQLDFCDLAPIGSERFFGIR
ncbi:MAG: family 20 glycosylhydrolase [Clostridia bacterium]|nr:family 20 glycosylhydrolase [Clostridia bacterium]